MSVVRYCRSASMRPSRKDENRFRASAGGRRTIYDVAQRAGVSISTVSLALNSPDRVRPETLDKIYQSVQELGYRPKAEATILARKSTRRIGVVAPFVTYGSFMERLRGVMAAAEKERYEIVLYDHESYALRHHLADSLSLSQRLDGLILMAIPMSDVLAKRLVQDGLPTVLVEFARPEFSSVVIDDEAGGRLAAQYLLQRGHRRFAFLGEGWLENTSIPKRVFSQKDLRLRGFRSELAAANFELADEQILDTFNSVESGRQAALKILDTRKPPSAIFAHSDVLAAGVLQAARDRQLHVPSQLAVMGFDDREFAGYLGLTTIRQPLFDSGQIAMNLLTSRLVRGTSSVPQMVGLPLEVVARETA
jgi:DNA-binding LacI/PurR family transcriptional regulator